MIKLLKNAALVVQPLFGDRQEFVQDSVAEAMLCQAEASRRLKILEQTFRQLTQQHTVVNVE